MKKIIGFVLGLCLSGMIVPVFAQEESPYIVRYGYFVGEIQILTDDGLLWVAEDPPEGLQGYRLRILFHNNGTPEAEDDKMIDILRAPSEIAEIEKKEKSYFITYADGTQTCWDEEKKTEIVQGKALTDIETESVSGNRKCLRKRFLTKDFLHKIIPYIPHMV